MVINKKVAGIIVVLCIGILPIAASLWAPNIFKTSDTTLLVNPPNVIHETLVLGKRFSINISVANVVDLKGYQLELSFNTTMLDVVGVKFLPEENMPVQNCIVDDSAGVVWINATYEGDSITTDDPVTLTIVTFKMMAYGECSLHLYDTNLVNSSGNPISHDAVDGMVVIRFHDIAVINVSLSINETYFGRVVNVTVNARNKGNSVENFTVSIYHNDTLFGTYEVINLAPHSNTTITFSWNTSDVVAGYSYVIKTEASTIPHEANTTNNIFVGGEIKIKIIGDVNGDNVVDINDLIAWDMAWGSIEGEVNWNPQADINGDGTVDNNDGILIVQNYHNTA